MHSSKTFPYKFGMLLREIYVTRKAFSSRPAGPAKSRILGVPRRSGGEAEIEAALFIELLRGVQIELVEGHGAVEAFASDVTERAVFPGEGCGKE